MSEDRNEAGQFTEPLTGQAGVEAAQGYVPMPSDEPPEQPASDIDTEVARLRASRPPGADRKARISAVRHRPPLAP
jgi:hypothetical protein